MKIKHIVKKKDEAPQKESVAELLKRIACDEIISYYAYSCGAQNVHGENWMDARQQFEEHAKDELEHFESIRARLYQLGVPVHAVFKTVAETCNYYWDLDMSDVKQACEIAKKAEEEAITVYKKLLVVISETKAEERDFATQRLAKKNLEAEEDHREDMVRLIEEF